MKNIILGKSGVKKISIDLQTLLRTRLLIQANSGGGKSWLIRRIAEQAFGKVQIIVIDPEGEFATLREKYGYVLVGNGGETPADPRSAGLVAEKLLELNASAVCDLFEAFRKNPQGRHTWVKNFCNALLDAPKKLWHPVLVIVDEFHKFVPEKGSGESEASEAVIGIGTAGRKRGYCLVGATQRLGKARKDVTAEMLNRLVGPTFEDVDLERAADLLSVTKSDRTKFFGEMRVLEPGNFYALGRAICKERMLVSIGNVETTHPEVGTTSYVAEPPAAPDKIKALLPKLADLPQAAEAKAKTEQELRAEITQLKRQLTTKPKEVAPAKPEIIEKPVILNGELSKVRVIADQLESVSAKFGAMLNTAVGELVKVIAQVSAPQPVRAMVAHRIVTSQLPTTRKRNTAEKFFDLINSTDSELVAGERGILQALARCHPMRLTLSQIARLASTDRKPSQSMKSSSFQQYVRNLKRKQYIAKDHIGYYLTDAGMDKINFVPSAPQSPDEAIEMWRSSLIAGEREIYDYVLARRGETVLPEEISSATSQSLKSSSFQQYIRNLVRNSLLEKEGKWLRFNEKAIEMI